jgi:hypothetical protein
MYSTLVLPFVSEWPRLEQNNHYPNHCFTNRKGQVMRYVLLCTDIKSAAAASPLYTLSSLEGLNWIQMTLPQKFIILIHCNVMSYIIMLHKFNLQKINRPYCSQTVIFICVSHVKEIYSINMFISTHITCNIFDTGFSLYNFPCTTV